MHTLAELNGTTNGALTRREAREAFEARSSAGAAKRRVPAKAPALPASVTPAKPKRPLRRFANIFVLVAAVGVVGTIAIPAYAFNPGTQTHSTGSAVIDTMKRANAQSADVATDAAAPAAAHEAFQATSVDDIANAKQAQARAAAAKAAAAKAASYSAAYTGPTAADYLATVPAGTSYNLADVLAKAETYAGTPYQYGGATPAGFDCSGFVMFVYAQFGVSLPHSSSQQGHIGQTISLANAKPGDVIALNDGSHVGFYAGTDASGNVMIYDAPKPGGVVGERAMWTSAYHIQHFEG